MDNDSLAPATPPADASAHAEPGHEAAPPLALPPGADEPFRAELGQLLARAARLVLPLYLLTTVAIAVVDLFFSARSPGGGIISTALAGWVLVTMPMLALIALARWPRWAPQFPLLLLSGLTLTGIGWIVLRAGAADDVTSVAGGSSLALLFLLLLAASQPRLRFGLLLCGLLWLLYGAVLALTGQGRPAVADHLLLAQAVVIGAVLSVLLGRLARAEFSARRTLTVHRDRFERIRQSRTRFIAAP